MSLLIGALSIGFILSLLALGVYVSFRIFGFPDITTEGSITLGAAVAGVLLVHGWPPFAATLAGALRGLSGRRVHRLAGHQIPDQPPALRHHHHDRALLREPSHHGQKQSTAAA